MQLKFLFFVITSSITFSVMGQSVIKGKIIDSVSLQPIAFANLTLDNGRDGWSTDVEGNYSLTIPATYSSYITITHVSYKSKKMSLGQLRKTPTVLLFPTSTQLGEIVITGAKEENPAFRIIRQATKHKSDHNPKYLKSYQYISYNKFTATTSEPSKKMDSILHALRTRPDTVKLKKKQKKLLRLDSLFKTTHLFLSESVTEKKVINPGQDKEKLIGLKVSGFNSPIFTNIANSYQPISFYNDNIFLLNQQFVSPVNKGTFSRYNFKLADTLYSGKDTIYVISYQPKPRTFFNGLKGIISISTDGWAIKNVIATATDSLAKLGIRVQQNYEKVDGHWFPTQLNTDITVKEYSIASRKMLLQQRSFLKEIKINPDLNPADFGDVKLDLTMPDLKENKMILKQFRHDSLDVKEQRTYSLLNGTLRKLQWVEKAIEIIVIQTIPFGPLELDLNRFSRFNRYESNRLGAGLYTSNSFSKWLRVGGYAGYGFRDNQWKYGGEMQFIFNENKNFFLKFSYAKDIDETGSSHNITEGQFLGSESLRNLLGYQYDRNESEKVELGYLIFPDVHADVFISRNQLEPIYNYHLQFNNEPINHFTITETGFTARYVRNESYMTMRGKKVFIGQRFPVITFSLAQAVAAFDAQNFNYTSIDFSAKELFTHRDGSKTRFFLGLGYIHGIAPYGKLYNGSGARSSRFLVDDHFQTMGLYEFTASQYASVFLQHNFGNVLLNKRYSKPELLLYHHAGIGRLENPNVQLGLPLKSFEKGFLESGVGMNNIFRVSYARVGYLGFGGAAFYRYGPYQFTNASDNFYLRATIKLVF